MADTRSLARRTTSRLRSLAPLARKLIDSATSEVDDWMTAKLGEAFNERLARVPLNLTATGVDPFGMDPAWTKYALASAAALHHHYFRTEVHGASNVPASRVLLVSNHSGQVPIDAALIGASLFMDVEPPRFMRAMVDKWTQTLPFVSLVFSRCGQVVGVPENAKQLLESDEAMLVFPEGMRGISKPFSKRYQLEDFGLGFMRLAIETNTPIVPIAVVGGEEQYISLGNFDSLAKTLRMPSIPILPQLLLPFGALPLPTKYRIYFGEPMRFSGDPDDDDAIIEEKVFVVKSTVQSMLNRGLNERRSISLLMRGEGTILVTGACGRLGKRVIRMLHRDRSVLGVDRREFPDKPKDVRHEKVDIRRKKLKDIFRSEPIEAVVHLGVMHDPRASQAEHHSWNVAGFQKLMEYVAQFDVPKLVVLSSANVYGPQPDNAQFLDEDAPLLGGARFGEIRDLIEVDMLAQGFFWKHPGTETVILRPVHILGSVHNAASNFLRLSTIPRLMGFDPMIQVIHESDVVSALKAALAPGKRGIYNVAGPDPLPLTHAIKILGRPSIPVPYSMAKAVLKRLWSFRLTNFPAPELDHIRFVCMVDDRRARAELGYQPDLSIEETVQSVDADTL